MIFSLLIFRPARGWHGLDPYSPRVIAQLWPREAGIPPFLVRESENGTLPARRGIPSPYPPTGLPLLVPLALLPWRSAIVLWIALNVIAFGSILFSTLGLVQTPLCSRRAAAIVLCALVLAPFHTAIAVGNIVLVVFALGMLACLCLERRSDVTAGFLLAAAAALKPTIALPFLIYFVVKGRWRALIVGLAAGLGLFLIADLRLRLAGVDWVASYFLNSRRMFASGANNDFTAANHTRFDLLNLQVVVFQIVRNRALTEILSVLASLGLLARWIFRLRWKADARLYDLGVLAVIFLLPFYHRFYDSCLLLLPLAWALTQVTTGLRTFARAVLILAIPFMLPGAALLQQGADRNLSLHVLAQSWWWQLLVAPHQVWIILLIATVLLAAQAKMVEKEAGLVQANAAH